MMKRLTFLLFLIPMFVIAQKDSLDPVTVVGSLHQQKVATTGRNIISIKGEQLRNLPVHSIDELLRYVPGLEVQMRGPAGSQSDLLIRGGTFQQVLVLLDGMRVNDPLTGHFNSYIPISVAEIDRIEVLKGASSAIYGSEAVGGVISIITKIGSAKTADKRSDVAGVITVGQYGLKSIDAGITQQSRKTALSAGVVSNNADGQPQRGSKGYFHNHTISASVRTALNDHWSLQLRSAIDRRDFSAQNYYTAFLSDTATEKVNGTWQQMQLSYQKGHHVIRWQSGYKSTYDEYLFKRGMAPNQNRSSLLQSQFHYDQDLGKGNHWVNGVQYVQKRIRSNDRGNHVVSQIGFYSVGHWQITPQWHVSPALRVDVHQRAGVEWVPQVNTAYMSGKWVLRASAGKSTRDADFTERYNNTHKSLVTSGNIGNPNLNMEHAISYEAGVDYILGQQLKVSAGYFNKKYKQLIDWVYTPYSVMPATANLVPTGSYYLASNISSLRTKGVETDLQWDHRAGNHLLLLRAGFLWMESDPGASLYISSHARWIMNQSLQYQYKRLRIATNSIYKFRNTQTGNASLASLSKDYFVLNTKVDLQVRPEHWSVFVAATNLFNRSYADRFGVPMPGRWLMAGIQFR